MNNDELIDSRYDLLFVGSNSRFEMASFDLGHRPDIVEYFNEQVFEDGGSEYCRATVSGESMP